MKGMDIENIPKNYLSWKQRFRIKLLGRAYLFPLGNLKYYAARCKAHGYYGDYEHGGKGALECPKCRKLRMGKW